MGSGGKEEAQAAICTFCGAKRSQQQQGKTDTAGGAAKKGGKLEQGGQEKKKGGEQNLSPEKLTRQVATNKH